MRPEGLRLGPAQRRFVYGTSLAVLVTGGLWLLFHYFVRRDGPFGDAPHPLESWWLRLHGAAAMASLLVLGSLVRGHIRAGWKAHRNRLSGAVLAGVAAALVATGWALYYVSAEAARPWISLVHWSIGIAASGLLAVHVLAGRRTALRIAHGHKGRHRRSSTQPQPPREPLPARGRVFTNHRRIANGRRGAIRSRDARFNP